MWINCERAPWMWMMLCFRWTCLPIISSIDQHNVNLSTLSLTFVHAAAALKKLGLVCVAWMVVYYALSRVAVMTWYWWLSW